MCPILFTIGPITIYTYGFFVFIGAVSGYRVFIKRVRRLALDEHLYSNILVSTVLAGFIGAKLLFIALEWPAFLHNPLVMLRSGFIFYGGVIAGALTLVILTRRHKIAFFSIADLLALPLPLAHAFGRLGCFFYGCCYGRPTASRIGIEFPPGSPAGGLGRVIPTQLIEAAVLFVIFFILLVISKRPRFAGYVVSAYFMMYGVARFIIEFYRGDPRGHIFIFSTSQCISLVLIACGALIFLTRHRHASFVPQKKV